MSDEQPQTRSRPPTRPDDRGAPVRRRNPLLSGIGVVAVILVVMLTLAYSSRRGGSDQEAAGTRPAGTARNAPGTATAADNRPAAMAGGVTVGHPRTREGAQSAAANYATAYGSSAMFKTASRQALIAAIGDPATKSGLQTRADAAFTAQMALFGLDADGNAPKGLVFVCRALPVGTKPVSYTADSATVEVWGAGLVGLAGAGSTKPVSEAWSTTTMRLSWADGDWKLVDFSQKEGPTPVSGLQTASGAAEIAQAVRDFEELRYAR